MKKPRNSWAAFFMLKKIDRPISAGKTCAPHHQY
jgi:hypothetical protein